MKTFQFKNATISYTIQGKGEIIVLLHGFLENITMWGFFVPVLLQNKQIITLDLLGHGKSDCLGYVHSMELQAEMIESLLLNLKIEKVHFVGHSMGGYVALAFAEMFPKAVQSLYLLNSTAFEDSLERKKNRDRAIKAVKMNFDVSVKMSISNLFSEKNRTLLLSEIENTKTEALKTSLQGVIAAQEGMKLRKNRVHILQENNFDVTLILGKQDPVLNYDENVIQIQNTSTKLITFNDGHMSHIENQSELLKVLSSI